MNALFAPKGEKSEWRMLYDALFHEAEPGTVVTYDEINETLGRDIKANRAPIYRARRFLADVRRCWLEPVPGIGYRVSEPGDHVRISLGHKRKSKRQLGIAVKVLESTDLSKLDPGELSLWDEQQKMTFALWAVFAHEARLRRIEAVLKEEGLL